MFDYDWEDPPPPDPPPPESKDIANDASFIEWILSDVMRHKHAAYYLSGAMHSLQLSAMGRSEQRQPTHRKDRLLSALAEVHNTFLTLFPDHKDQQMALNAFDAAVGMVVFWSQSDAERADLDRRARYEMNLCIRWLRNACHNIDIIEQIDETAAS